MIWIPFVLLQFQPYFPVLCQYANFVLAKLGLQQYVMYMTFLKLALVASMWLVSPHKLINSKGYYTVFTTRVKVGENVYSISNPSIEQVVPGTASLVKYGWHCVTSAVQWETELGAIQTVYCSNDIDGILLATGARCDTNFVNEDRSSLVIDQPDDHTVTPVAIVVSCNTRSIRKD